MIKTPTKFCVVGIGNHSITKIIPAIEKNSQILTAVVSSQSGQKIPFQTKHFYSLQEALKKLPMDVVFFIGSPPLIHFDQCEQVLLSGRNVFVEKPAFVREGEAQKIMALATQKNLVLVEALMHRHSNIFQLCLQDLGEKNNEIEAININFLLPNLPKGTFRNSGEFGCSILYDIGCYALSFLAEINVKFDNLKIEDLLYKNKQLIRAVLQANYQQFENETKIKINIGVGESYVNEVSLSLKNNKRIVYAPFFYGRQGTRTVHEYTSGKEEQCQKLYEDNCYCKLLAITVDDWRVDQEIRFQRIIAVTRALERLEKQGLIDPSAALRNNVSGEDLTK